MLQLPTLPPRHHWYHSHLCRNYYAQGNRNHAKFRYMHHVHLSTTIYPVLLSFLGTYIIHRMDFLDELNVTGKHRLAPYAHHYPFNQCMSTQWNLRLSIYPLCIIMRNWIKITKHYGLDEFLNMKLFQMNWDFWIVWCMETKWGWTDQTNIGSLVDLHAWQWSRRIHSDDLKARLTRYLPLSSPP